MGRYTTVQAYSDNNPKLVHVSYDQAKGKGDEEGKAGGKLVVEKTDQVMGSCAGAGSGEFHTYRAHRRREMHRVAAMDEEAKNEEATAKLQAAIEQGKRECEERTRKKAEKRKRKKQAAKSGNSAKQAKTTTDGAPGGDQGAGKGKGSSFSSSGGATSSSGSGGGCSGSDGGAEEEEFVYIPEANLAAAGGDGGSGFKNDGSFLEMMKKELEKSGAGGKPTASANGAGKAITAK
eukprot:g8542.t1